jgi:alkanesulfonate monooxygenase SsuD/methylene tetrahydromethanopterin reductase-like flavin-dependent oxidoreductase (luciferase family)
VTPLRVGLALGGAAGGVGFARMLDRATYAETIGLHSVWVPEGHFRRGALASPLIVLAAIAARTTRLGVGTTSLLLTVHHPLRVALEAAAVDALSNGRLLLGLGRGFSPALFRAFGIDAARKRDRFDEALDTILAAWRGEPVPLESEYFATLGDRPIDPLPRPVQSPHPPLFVAAFGPKALAQAARRGLAYLASPLEPLPLLIENHALHRAALGDRATSGPFRAPVMRTVHVAATEAEAQRVRAALAVEAAASARALPPALTRAAAGRPEDRVVVGGVSEVVDGLERYRECIGMDLLIVRSEVPGLDEEAQRASLDRLASDVLPAFGD